MKGTIEISKISITDLDTDVIVNAANEQLAVGGGVCGAIFRAAGYAELQNACRAIGRCDTGDAVITPGFKLKAKYIVHAVGPRWTGGEHGESKKLIGAYSKALQLAADNHCRSIGFPLISAGIFGYPVRLAWNDAVSACESFLNSHPEYEIHIIFAVLDSDIMSEGLKVLRQSGASVYKIATRDDWTAMDMPEQNDTFTLVRSFSDQQMEAMRRGHIPQAMEDKWFWYMDENTLFAHRSWTGFCIYKIEFHGDGSHIVTVNRDPEQYTRASIEEDRDNLNKLLDWWSQPGYDHYNEWLAETADAIKKQKNDITRAKRNTGIPEAKKEGQKDYDHQ